jgi:hypothetical protein
MFCPGTSAAETIDRTRALRFRPLLESEYTHKQRDGGDADQDDAERGKIALRGSEFVADVELGDRLERGCRLRGRD